MTLERLVQGPIHEVFAAFAEPAGRVALFGGEAAREVSAPVAQPFCDVVLDGDPCGGRLAVRLAPGGARETRVAIDIPEDAGAGIEALAGALLRRLEAYLGGTVALDLLASAEPPACFEAWTDPAATRAFAAVEVEQDLRPGGALSWTFLAAGDAADGGRFLDVDPERRRVLFEWGSEEPTLVCFEARPIGMARSLVSVTHSGFGRGRLAAARGSAEGWLWHLARLRDYVEGAVRLEREVLAPRERVEAALADVPPPASAEVRLQSSRERRGHTIARWEVPRLPEGPDRPAAFERAAAEGEAWLLRLAARAAGALLDEDELPPGLGPRRYSDAILVPVPREVVFRAIARPEERARWAPEGERRRAIGVDEPAALEEIWALDLGPATALRFDLDRTACGRTRVRLTQAGFAGDRQGGIDLRSARLAWALHLENLRAYLVRGADLRPLSRTRRLYPEAIDAAARIGAPPAQVAAELARGARERGEMTILSEESTLVLTGRALERPEEASLIEWGIEREGAEARVTAIQRGFAVEEEFWSFEDADRLVPGMAIARGEEERRLHEVLAALERALGGPEAQIRVEVEVAAPPEAVWDAWTDPDRIGAWLVGDAQSNPWAGGRFLWLAAGGERMDAGEYLEVVPPRRLVLGLKAAGRPTIAAIEIDAGTVRETRISLVQTGFAGAAGLAREERALWAERLARLVEFVEGRVERSFEVAAPIGRAAEAIRDEASLRGWLHPEAALERDPEPALVVPLGHAGLDRCRILADEAPRRLALEWAQAGGEAGLRTTLAFTLDESERRGPAGAAGAAEQRTRVRVEVSGFARGPAKRALMAEERERLEFIARSLAAALEGKGGFAADSGGVPLFGRGVLEIAREVPLGRGLAFAAIAARVGEIYGRRIEEAPPARLVALAPAAPGEPEGLTILTVEVEETAEGRSRARIVEEGFRESEGWAARRAIEERGLGQFLESLGG